MSGLSMEEFNINELAGATGLILGAVSGILVVIFKSRCYCKFRIGFSDNCNICMCERKPPPDNDSDDEKTDNKQDKILKKENKILEEEEEILEEVKSPRLVPKRKTSKDLFYEAESQPEPEPELDKIV